MNSVRGLLAASVISIQNSCFIYPACHKCFSRLLLDSRRFNCSKCGCTGEAKDASYRYRLSLKVADTSDLFDITVFGSCLDPFFGITAGDLQRCMQDFSQLSGDTNTDASPGVLVQAVETCFLGKRFIFGVKACAREDGEHSAASSILQKCSRRNRSTKALTACQLFLPNAAVAGFTVISCFHQLLQAAKPRGSQNSFCLPDASSAAADEPVSELSSLFSLSRSSWFVQSSGRESFSGSWQQSFSLTASVAWVTAEDSPSLEAGKLGSEQHEEGRPGSAQSFSGSLNNQTPGEPQFFCSSSGKDGEKEEDELSSQPSQAHSISAADKLESVSSWKAESSQGNSSRLLEQLVEFGVKSSHPKTDSRHSYPEQSPSSLCCKRDLSASDHGSGAVVPQVDSGLWDEFPFSESLNAFLARLEDGTRSVVSSPSLGAGKQALPESADLGVGLNQAYPRQRLGAGALPEASSSGRFLPPAENDSWENTLCACSQAGVNPLGQEVSTGESSSSVLSPADKEGEASCFTPNPHLCILSPSLPVPSEPSASRSRCVQSKAANADISKSAWSCLSLHSTAEHGEASCSKRSQAAAPVLPAHHGCLAGCENKENSFSTPNHKPDLRFRGAWDSVPATPSTTRRMHKRELTLTELSENTFKGASRREVLLWNSIFPEGSYNASADLFDASAREAAKPVEFLNKSCNSLTEEDTLTEEVTAPELVLYPGEVPCSSSKPSSLLPRSPPALRKHSTPVAYSLGDPEWDAVTAQHFVPHSQSTPMTKPLQKLWPVAESSSSATVFTPKNPAKAYSRCKRSRPSFQHTLLQQLAGGVGKRERPSTREDQGGYSSVSQQFLNSQQPAADWEEWIPPSASKRLKPVASSTFKAVSWAADLQGTCGQAGREPLLGSEEKSENEVCFQREGSNPGEAASIPTTPVAAAVTKALSVTCSPAAGRTLLSSGHHPGGVLEGAAAWSPELFSQAHSPLSSKAKY